MKILRRILFFAGIIILIPVLFFSISGGGFGDKKNQYDPFKDRKGMILFAHRGLDNYFPENSLAGIAEAQKEGFTAIETDIRKTKDQIFVLFHDTNCSRLLGLDTNLSELSFTDLQMHPLLFNGISSSSSVIRLDELLDFSKSSMILYLDVKTTDLSDADSVASLIKEKGLMKSVLVASTDFIFITYLEFWYPEINTVLEGFNKGKEWAYRFIPVHFKPDFLSSDISQVDSSHVVWLNQQNILSQKIVYGVNSKNFDAVRKSGISRIILDYDTIQGKNIFSETE